jgi:hypothetical protein
MSEHELTNTGPSPRTSLPRNLKPPLSLQETKFVGSSAAVPLCLFYLVGTANHAPWNL